VEESDAQDDAGDRQQYERNANVGGLTQVRRNHRDMDDSFAHGSGGGNCGEDCVCRTGTSLLTPFSTAITHWFLLEHW
jgi:hypothetical protein